MSSQRRHGAVLRGRAAAARGRARGPFPEGISPREAAALGAGAEAADAGAPTAGGAGAAGRAGRVVIRVDGASRGNPGPAGFGAILEGSPGGLRVEQGSYLGETTNNVAEYEALCWALAEARRRGFEAAEVRSDSELLVKQMRGEYRVRHPRLQRLHARAAALAREFTRFEIRHVPRAENAAADALANRAIDEAHRRRAARLRAAPGEGE